MMDIKFIQKNKELIKKVIKDKGIELNIDKLLKLDKERRDLISKSDKLKAEMNKKAKTKPSPEEIKKLRKLSNGIKKLDQDVKKVEKEYDSLMLLVPNIYSEDTPVGSDESSNKEVYKWEEPTKFDFKPKDYIQLGRDLDIIDLEAGAKTSGYRGYYLKNEAAQLHFAVLWYAFNKIIKKGFTPMVPPTLLREFALIGSGHFPTGKEDVYQIGNPGRLANGTSIKNPIFLAGTSEPSLLAYYAGKTFKEEELPIKLCGFSQCYRSEVGSYGKDIKGLYRIHEFMKVEQVVLCRNDLKESNGWLEKFREIAQEILKDLKLPHRVIQICTGDMGVGKYKMYDIETWMPSRNGYGETHSDSNLTDWQTRRLNIKYKTKKGKVKLAHALNNTVIASPRILIAILENYQQKDGSIVIPKVLKKYVGKDRIERRK